MRRTFALLLFACFASSARADLFDDWCKTVHLPSSIAICSDPDLLQLTRERQHAYDEVKVRLSPDGQKALLSDQNSWIKSYPLACGLEPDIAPSLPLAPATKECMARAGRARIAYLRGYTSSQTTKQPAAKVPAVTHLMVSRWWCPFYSGYYPNIANCPNWEGRQVEVDCATATEADVLGLCREERVKRAQEAARAAEAEAARVEVEKEAARARAEEEEEQAKAAAQRRAAQEAKAEERLRYQEKVAEQVKHEEALGYKPIDFDDFVLDKRSLAASQAKVAIHGFYTKKGESELLSKLMSAAEPTEDNIVPLLTENAPRDLRKQFLVCRSTIAECPITLLGHVASCTSKNLYGVEHNLICLSVDDGWNIPVPE